MAMKKKDSEVISSAVSVVNPADVVKEAGAVHHPTPVERAAIGMARRRQVPRAAHGAWQAAAERKNPIDLLEAQARRRVPELVPIRYGRMLVSPFAFYRGAAAIMAADLASMPNTGLQVQLCGDAHLANFGGFASPERELILDINDFDETLPGPWEWDLKRLAASVEIAGRERSFDAKTRRSLVLGAVGEYHRAMLEFAEMRNLELWYLYLSPAAARARWGGLVKHKVMGALEAEFAHAYHRDNQRAFEKLTRRVGGQLLIVDSPPLVVPVENLLAEAARVPFEEKIHRLIGEYRSTLLPDRRFLLESFRYADMARKVVGVGSVGTRTWILLLLGRDDQDPLFLQVKEAQASVLEPYLAKSVYTDHGKRVVEGQWLMQAASDIFLGWVHISLGIDDPPHDYYIRQLWDWKISADIEVMSPAEMLVYGKMCAWTLARAHARSGDRIAIAAYLGKNNEFDNALVDFSSAYADQNERDYQSLVVAVKSGEIRAETGI